MYKKRPQNLKNSGPFHTFPTPCLQIFVQTVPLTAKTLPSKLIPSLAGKRGGKRGRKLKRMKAKKGQATNRIGLKKGRKTHRLRDSKGFGRRIGSRNAGDEQIKKRRGGEWDGRRNKQKK